MNSKTVIHFCFIKNKSGNFITEINQLLHEIFKGMDFTWDLEKKDMNEAEIVIAQLNGTSDWAREDEVVHYLDEKADETFWEYVYGLHIVNSPLVKGCNCCGVN